jgi:putative oxidoreductase
MEIALLALRLAIGLVFAAHGAQKLFGAFGGEGISGTADSFERIGLRPGRLQAWAAGSTEFFGGSLIALGLVTPVAAVGLIAVMTAAVLTVNLRNGFSVTSNGWEYNLVLVAALFALAGIGAGDWSLGHALGIDLAGTLSAVVALGVGVLGGAGVVLSGHLAPGRNSVHGRRYAERHAA